MRLELEAAVPENAVAGGVVVYLPEMRRAIAGILCFFAFTSATGCKKEPEKKVDSHPSTVPTETTASAQPSATPPKTKEKPATEWVVFEPEPTKFSLSFPGKPAESTTPTPSPAGEMTHHDAQLSYRECYYAIGWMDFPAGAVLDPKKALDGARDGAVKSGGGRIRTEKSVKLNGKHPGRDIVFVRYDRVHRTRFE